MSILKSPISFGLIAILVGKFFLFIVIYDYRLKISEIKGTGKDPRDKIALQDIHHDEVGFESN